MRNKASNTINKRMQNEKRNGMHLKPNEAEGIFVAAKKIQTIILRENRSQKKWVKTRTLGTNKNVLI